MNYFAEKLHNLTQKISGNKPQAASMNKFADSMASVQQPTAGPSRNADENSQLGQLEKMEREEAMRMKR